jgi:hypothetical protein
MENEGAPKKNSPMEMGELLTLKTTNIKILLNTITTNPFLQ